MAEAFNGTDEGGVQLALKKGGSKPCRRVLHEGKPLFLRLEPEAPVEGAGIESTHQANPHGPCSDKRFRRPEEIPIGLIGGHWVMNRGRLILGMGLGSALFWSLSVYGQDGTAGKGFEFPWGAGYGSVRPTVSGVIEDKEGDTLRFRRGDVEYVYYFNRPLKIRNVEVEEHTQEGKKVFVYKKTELEPAFDAGVARLFSVSINLPYIPFSGELPPDLIKLFGKPGNVTGDSIDMENLSVYVRIHLETYRGKRYLKRFVFTSKEEAGRMNLERARLKQDEAQAVKEAIERANNPVKPGAGKEERSPERLSLPGIPGGLEAQLIGPAGGQ